MGRHSKQKKLSDSLSKPDEYISPKGNTWHVLAPNTFGTRYGQVSENEDGSYTALWVGPISGKVQVVSRDYGTYIAAINRIDNIWARWLEKNYQLLRAHDELAQAKKIKKI